MPYRPTRSTRDGSRTPSLPLDNAFSPAYLARLRERDDSLTAAEAELAGPWKIEPVPGRPGAVAILRIWEDLAAGDPPVGVLWHLEPQLGSQVLEIKWSYEVEQQTQVTAR